MELIHYRKTIVSCKKKWYNGKNYGTIPNTMEHRFSMEKHGRLPKNMKR